MKKILFFIPTLGGGGAENVLVNLVNHLDTKKYDITVQTLFDVGINKKRLKKEIKYKYVFRRIFRGNIHILKLFSPYFLYKKMISEHYDIIVAYLEGPVTRIVSGCPKGKTKIIAWIHTELKDINEFSNSYRSKKEMREAYERYNDVAFVSNEALNSFQEKLKYNIKAHIYENIIDDEEIIRKSKERITNQDFLDDNNLKVITVGRLIKVKGFERLIKIHKRLLTNNIFHSLYILGSGSEAKRLKKLINKYHVNDTVHLYGYVENPYKYVKNSDLYVCSSYKEGYNTAVVEALILNKPIVTTRCSGMDNILKYGEFGKIVENNDQELYEGIKEMLCNENIRKEYQKNTKQKSEYFSIMNRIEKIEKLFL